MTDQPYTICTGSEASGSATLIVDVATSTTARDLSYLLIGNSSAQTVIEVLDSKDNPYSFAVAVRTGNQRIELWASLTTSALVSGTDYYTVTYSGTTGNKLLIARGCSGIASATPIATNEGNGTSASPSSGSTGTLPQPNALVVGGIENAAGGGTPSSVSFGTGLTVSNSAMLTEFDEIVSSIVAQTASGTITSALWAALVAAFPVGNPPSPSGIIPLLAGH